MRTFATVAVMLAISVVGCSLEDNCATATADTESQIRKMCNTPDYSGSQFCKVCVAHEFFSVDDSCMCRPLKFDTDFCAYDSTDRVVPKLRDALDFARSVCRGGAKLPDDGDAGQGGASATSSTAATGSMSATTTVTSTTTSTSATSTGATSTGATGGGGGG